MNSPGMGPGRRRIPGGIRPFGIRPTGPSRNGPGQCSIEPRDVMALFMQGQRNPQLRLQRCMCVRQCMGNGPQNSQDVVGDDEDEQRRGYNSHDSNDNDNDDSENEFCDDDDEQIFSANKSKNSSSIYNMILLIKKSISVNLKSEKYL